MTRGGLLFCVSLLVAAPAAAWAQGGDAGWVVDLGAVGRVRPTHLGSARYVTDVAPVLEATYGDRLSISLDDGAKWTAGQVGALEFGPVAEYRQSFANGLPRGAFRMDDTLELGGFGQVRTPVGLVEARLRHAVNGYDGWSGDLALDAGAPVKPDLQLAGQLRLGWADTNFSQEYFGLRPDAPHRFGLPQFLRKDYVSAGAEFDMIGTISPRARLVLALSADRMLGEMTRSPLFSTRDVYGASLGVTYHWSRSDRRNSS